MARQAATDTGLHLERGKVEFVMEGGQRLLVELVEMQRLLNCVAAVVHISLRLQQQYLVAPDPALAGEGAEFFLPGAETVHFGDGVDRHEADIVPVQRILRAGISKACPDLHRARVSNKNAHPASEMGALVLVGV